MAPEDTDVRVVRDRRREVAGHVVRIRVLRVPESDTYPEGVKYAFHCGEKGAANPVIRYDNHHGMHERHVGDAVEEVEFEGLGATFDRFVDELPAEITEAIP